MTAASFLRERIERTLIDSFEVRPGAVEPGQTLEGLGLDSLAIVELIDIMVADLDIALEDDALRAEMTVDEVIRVLHARMPR
jgi:acyl carrier protein